MQNSRGGRIRSLCGRPPVVRSDRLAAVLLVAFGVRARILARYSTRPMGHRRSIVPHPGQRWPVKKRVNPFNLRILFHLDHAMNAKNELAYLMCLVIPVLMGVAVYINLAR